MQSDWIIPALILLAAVGLLGVVTGIIILWLRRGPRAEVYMGALWRFNRFFVRMVHRVKWTGLEQFRDQQHSGPLVVISNHTGAIDPLLIQAGCRFYIRWMMASDMMIRSLAWFWRRERIIPVDRDGRDSAAAREAIRHVQGGGAIGIFPEGRIVMPPHEIRPFHSGVGLVVARTKAPVMLVWVTGTPETTDTRRSIFSRSHAQVKFIELIQFDAHVDAREITQTLRERISEISGWPLNDQPMPPKTPDAA